MYIRNLQVPTSQELQSINEIWESCHKGIQGIPAPKYVVAHAVTENNGEIKSYGIVRCFGEALLYLDKRLSKFQQAKSFKLLMEQAIIECQAIGLDQLSAGVDNYDFEQILIHKYGFKPRQQMLTKEL